MAGFFDTLFGGGAEREAADRNRALAAQYGTDAQGYLKTGYDTGVGNLDKAVGAYAPLKTLGEQYNKSGTLGLDALGVNGPEGNARATQAFKAGPGYQFSLDQGIDAINRRRAGGSMYDSSNADLDTLKFAHGLSDQEYQGWLKNVIGEGNTGVGIAGNVAGGEAAGYGSLANLASQYAQNQTGVTGNQFTSNVNSSNLQGAGEAAGAKNLLGAGLSLATLAMNPIGGAAGLGSSLAGKATTGIGNFIGGLLAPKGGYTGAFP